MKQDMDGEIGQNELTPRKKRNTTVGYVRHLVYFLLNRIPKTTSFHLE